MHAIGSPRAGQIEKLGLVEIEAPTPGPGQVLVRVIAAAVNPADLKVQRGEFSGRVLHARTQPLVSGYDFSGVVETCGAGVADVKPGEDVFGFLPYSSGTRQGSFAERVVVDRATVGRKPAAIPHTVAAAAATPGLSAIQAMRDKGRLPENGRVLIIGAAGGVGSVAIGVARARGAHVTAVCSTPAIEFVRELGPDTVVDRRTQDPRTIAGPFDMIFDAAAAYSYASMRHQLASAGAFVTTLPSLGWFGGKLLSAVSHKRCHLFMVQPVSVDLDELATWIVGGMRVPIDSTFAVRDLAKAFERLGRGDVRGRIAIEVESGW